MSIFNFKQFKISHAQSFKVGTDGVLIGCWVDLTESKRILDIGTGSGLIALVIAQRTNEKCLIEGLEIDESSYQEATSNAQKSPWTERVRIHHSTLQEFNHDSKFDHIVTNPPYFIHSTKSGKKQKDTARHTDTLSFEDILIHSKELLSENGKLSVVLPTVEAQMFSDLGNKNGFYLTRLTEVKTKLDKPVERHLMTFERVKRELIKSKLVIQKGGRNEYTDEYIALTKEFYTIL